MKKSKKKSSPALPNAHQLGPLLQLQQQYSQVGAQTPFGSQQYRTNPDGSRTLVTSLDPRGQALVDRAQGLAMTDSEQVGVPGQVNDIASQLANRVAGRYGAQPGGGFQLSGTPAKGTQAKPMLPPAQNTQNYGG